MTTPQYNPNVPVLPGDTFAVSQPDILANFQALSNIFQVNHETLESVTSNSANHTIIELIQQSTGFQTDVGEISVYVKEVEGQTDQVFLRYQGNGTEVQITNYQLYTVGNNAYFTFLPGKIILYFGVIAMSPTTINLVPPVAKNIMTVNFTPLGPAVNALKPNVTLPSANDKGFITSINVLGATPVKVQYYYLVLANF
jgi:hypothetical protein